MNEFYLEMANTLKELRVKRMKRESEMDKEEDGNENRFDCASLISTRSEIRLMNDPKLCGQYTKVKEFDEQLREFDLLLRDVKVDRIDYQKEICDVIKRIANDKNDKKFLQTFCDSSDDDKDTDDEHDPDVNKGNFRSIIVSDFYFAFDLITKICAYYNNSFQNRTCQKFAMRINQKNCLGKILLRGTSRYAMQKQNVFFFFLFLLKLSSIDNVKKNRKKNRSTRKKKKISKSSVPALL